MKLCWGGTTLPNGRSQHFPALFSILLFGSGLLQPGEREQRAGGEKAAELWLHFQVLPAVLAAISKCWAEMWGLILARAPVLQAGCSPAAARSCPSGWHVGSGGVWVPKGSPATQGCRATRFGASFGGILTQLAAGANVPSLQNVLEEEAGCGV